MCPAERLLLLPSDLPECQPVVLCSSQRNQRGWQQRVLILSERKGEIAAKSCSYAHNRCMSQPWIASPDTEDNDCVRHPQTENDRTQKDTEETASWKRCDRPVICSFRLCSFSWSAQGNRCWEGLRWLHREANQEQIEIKGLWRSAHFSSTRTLKQKSNEWIHLSPFYTHMHRGAAQVCKIH